MQVVTGKNFPYTKAVLNGYCRYSIRNEVYPAIIDLADGSVSGKLYSGLDQATLSLLDKFESTIYRRCEKTVCTAENVSLNAHVYILSEHYRNLLAGTPWEPERFRQHHLEDYLENCRRFSRGQSGRSGN